MNPVIAYVAVGVCLLSILITLNLEWVSEKTGLEVQDVEFYNLVGGLTLPFVILFLGL